MSQSLAQSFSQQMRMEQRLTPQLIQSMAVLQKSVADLETYVNDALESNAALEVAESASVEIPGSPERSGESTEAPATASDDSFARLASFTRAYDLESDDRVTPFARRPPGGDPDPKMEAMANAPGRLTHLNEHLLQQWSVLELDEAVRRTGEVVINHLDPDGYLRIPLAEIGAKVRPAVSTAILEEALKAVQRLDPTGVGARDIVECLLLQLDALPGDNQIEKTLIRNHLDDVIHNRLPKIAKETKYSLGEITEALRAMRSTVCLHPGYLVGDRSVPLIRPDVIVEYAESGNGLTVRLARGNLPKLQINDEVAALARSKANGKETREFARKQVDAASAIIDAVRFRQNRLMEVAKSIVEKQREFFDVGPEGLKVCRMNDLAAELGCDPSTISRTVAEKYMQTPRGIYPLRYFFTGGTEGEDGETIGWDRVKSRVRELVEAEDKRHPLNDEQIATQLGKEGMEISRRTVAKYRAQLDIPTVRQRRKF